MKTYALEPLKSVGFINPLLSRLGLTHLRGSYVRDLTRLADLQSKVNRALLKHLIEVAEASQEQAETIHYLMIQNHNLRDELDELRGDNAKLRQQVMETEANAEVTATLPRLRAIAAVFALIVGSTMPALADDGAALPSDTQIMQDDDGDELPADPTPRTYTDYGVAV